MLRNATLAILMFIVLIDVAGAETAVPDRLVIGYDHEGKIDASPQACVASVKEITEWNKAQTEKGAKQVCAMRKRHVETYAALQSNYKNFVKAFSVDRRLNLPGAVSNLKILIKACMDHKFGLTTGGHNIMIDIIENDIAAQCLVLGSNLIMSETARYNTLR
jgi:hypothetical protein